MTSERPARKDVVLVGAGHAHVAVLRSFGMKPVPGVRLILVTVAAATPYSGMVPGLIAGAYSFDEAHIDTGPLARFAGARLYHGEMVGLDLANQRVICRDRSPVPYDILSLDIGSGPNTADVPGAAERAIPVKPIDRFLRRFETMRGDVLARGGAARIVLVGAGAAGVELILSIEHRLRRDIEAAGHDPASLSLTLLSGSDDILPAFSRGMRRAFAAELRARGIAVRTGASAVRVADGWITLANGDAMAADHVLWTTAAAAPLWLKDTGLALSPDGFLRVDAMLRAVGHDNIFAAGDVAAFDPRPLPRSGVYAVRAGPVIARNIRARLTGKALKRFRPQRDALALLSTGDGRAVGTRNGLTFAGRWVWRWKDRIDRRFVARFNDLPI